MSYLQKEKFKGLFQVFVYYIISNFTKQSKYNILTEAICSQYTHLFSIYLLLTMVMEKYLMSATLNFYIVFVRIDRLREGNTYDLHENTAC